MPTPVRPAGGAGLGRRNIAPVVQGLPGNGWRGAVIDYTDTSSNGAPHDSNFVLIAYADPDVHTAFVTDYVNGQAGGEIVINDKPSLLTVGIGSWLRLLPPVNAHEVR